MDRILLKFFLVVLVFGAFGLFRIQFIIILPIVKLFLGYLTVFFSHTSQQILPFGTGISTGIVYRYLMVKHGPYFFLVPITYPLLLFYPMTHGLCHYSYTLFHCQLFLYNLVEFIISLAPFSPIIIIDYFHIFGIK